MSSSEHGNTVDLLSHEALNSYLYVLRLTKGEFEIPLIQVQTL